MKVNTNLLKSKMVLNGDSITSLAKAIGITRVTLSNKFNNKLEFKSSEISLISNRYNLNDDETMKVFGLGCNERD